VDPNETLRMLAKALLEEDKDSAREFYGYLKEWLARGGFEPAWTVMSKRQFQTFDPRTGTLSL
jgi:hypothetical protein